MTFPLTTAQALKSLAGVIIFGLGLDSGSFVSCQLRQLLSFAICEGIGLLFCGVPVLAWFARTVALRSRSSVNLVRKAALPAES